MAEGSTTEEQKQQVREILEPWRRIKGRYAALGRWIIICLVISVIVAVIKRELWTVYLISALGICSWAIGKLKVLAFKGSVRRLTPRQIALLEDFPVNYLIVVDIPPPKEHTMIKQILAERDLERYCRQTEEKRIIQSREVRAHMIKISGSQDSDIDDNTPIYQYPSRNFFNGNSQ